MSTIVVAGEVDFAPEKRDKALEGAKPLIDMALAEKGCKYYAWTLDPHDAGRIHVFEEWDSADDLQVHLEAEPYQKMLAHLSGFDILNADTRKYRVECQEPVYGADGVATARFAIDGEPK